MNHADIVEPTFSSVKPDFEKLLLDIPTTCIYVYPMSKRKQHNVEIIHDLPVANILDDYWREHASRLPSADQAAIAIRHLKAFFGTARISAVTRQAIEAYRQKRHSGAIGRPSIDNTVRRELGAALIPALNHAAKERRIARSDVPHIDLPDASAPRDRWLTPQEADRLREASQWSGTRDASGRYRAVHVNQPTRTRIFIEIALGIAARKGAIENLRKEQIDLEAGLIRLNPRGRLQTKKRRPTVPIPDRLREYLGYAILQFDGPFILGHNGPVRSGFDAAVKRAGLTDVTPHTLRHTWATWAAQRGVSMMEIAAVMGDTLSTVEKNYLHWSSDYLKNAVNF